MSSDLGSRNRFTKKVKIAAFKPNDSKYSKRTPSENGGSRESMSDRKRTPGRSRNQAENNRTTDRKRMPRRPHGNGENDRNREEMTDRKRTPRRTRDDGENGGTRKTMEDWQREARAFISNKTGKRVYPARGGAEGFEKKTGNGRSQVNVSSRTMWVSDISEDKPCYRNRKARSQGLDSGENEQSDELSSIERKAREKRKKRLREDHEGPGEKLMKSKRVIRIDRCDLSNKRLDDGISIPNIAPKLKKEKSEDSEEKNEISKNAQFRAIQPSPSILAYVEDNLLGRRRLDELRRAGYNIELTTPLDNIPNSTDLERERIEESVFRNKFDFFASAKVSSSFPPPNLPEIAFAGRSNVGKSSLLNALTRQWGVVRTSDKPGHTQTINFFDLGSKLCMVDLPGYGFAYAKEEVKEAWEELVKEYVSTRVGLKRVCLLIDTKWGMKPRDHELIQLMERAQTQYQIVLTKTDTVFPIDVARRAMQIEESLKANKSLVQPAVMVSSKSGAGIRSLRTVLAKIARFAKL